MDNTKKAVEQTSEEVKNSNKVYLLIAATAAIFLMFFAMTGYVYINEEETQKVRGYASERHIEEATLDVVVKDYIIRNDEKYRVVGGNDNVTLVSYDEDFEVTNHETYDSTKYQIENHLVREDEISTQSDNRLIVENESLPYDEANNYFLYDDKTNQAISLNEIVIDDVVVPEDSLLIVDSENATIEYSYADAGRGSGMSKNPESGEFVAESVMNFDESSTTLADFFGLPSDEKDDEIPDVDVAQTPSEPIIETPSEPSTETPSEPSTVAKSSDEEDESPSSPTVDLPVASEDPQPQDPVMPTLTIESVTVDKDRYYPGENIEVTIQLDNPSKLAIEEISINGKAYKAGEFEVSADKNTISKIVTASVAPKLQADVVTLDYVKYNNGAETVKLNSGEIAKADVLNDVPELTDVTLDKTEYVTNEAVVATLTFTNENNAPISNITVDGKTETFTETSNTDGATTGTIELAAPTTVGVDQPIGTIEEFTFYNGVEAEDVVISDKLIEEDVVYVTPVLEMGVTLDKSTYNPGETVTATLTFTNENNVPISSVTVDGVEKPFTTTTAGDYTVGTIELTAPQTAGTLATLGTIEGFTFDNGIDQAKYFDIKDVPVQANVLATTPELTGVELDEKVYVANSTVTAELTFINENNAPISTIKVDGSDKTFTEISNTDGTTVGTIELTAPTKVGIDQTIGKIEGFTFDNGVNQTEYVDITTDWPIAEDVVHEPVVVTGVTCDTGPYKPSDDVEVKLTFSNPTGAEIETVVVGGRPEQVTGQINDSVAGTSEGTITVTAPTTVGASQLIGEVTEVTYHDGINSGIAGTVTVPNSEVIVDVEHEPVVLTSVSYDDVPYTPGQDVVIELTFDNPTEATIENIGVDNGTSVNQVQLEDQVNNGDGTSTGTIHLTAPSVVDANQQIGTVSEVTYHDGINPGAAGTVTAASPDVIVDVIHEAVELTGINYSPGPYLSSDPVEVELTFSNPTGATIGNIGVNDGTAVVPMALENQQNNIDGTSIGTIYLTAPDVIDAGQLIGTIESFTYDHDDDTTTAEIAGTVNLADPNIIVNVTGEGISVLSFAIEDEDDDTDNRYHPGENILVTIVLNNPDDLEIEKIKINGTQYSAGEFTIAPDVDDTTVITKVINAPIAPEAPTADYQVVLNSVTYDKYGTDIEMVEVPSGAYVDADILYEIPTLSGTVTLDNSPYYPGDTATATLTFTNPDNAPISSVTVDGGSKTFTENTNVDGTTTGTIQFTVPDNIGSLKQIGNIESFTFNNGVNEEYVEIDDIPIQSNVVHKPVEVTDVSYDDVPYYPLDVVEVTLIVSNPTGATIEEIEVTAGGTSTWYMFTAQPYDSVNKTTTGTINLTAPGVGTDQITGEITGVKYHDGINSGTEGTVGLTSPDSQVIVDVVHEPVVLTTVEYTDSQYTFGQSVDVRLTFDNPTEAVIETVTVGGTPVAVTGQVDNGDGTSTGKITLTPTIVGLDQSLGTISGIIYDDDNDDLTAGANGTITATNLDIIVDVVHVKPTLEDVTYEDVHYTLGDSVDVELTFDNPTKADIETVTVGGNSVLVDDADQTDDGLGTTTVIITLTPSIVSLNQDLGTITEFTYDNDDDDITTGVVGEITATNLDVIVDVVHATPTLTNVTYTDRHYTLGENVEVELTFDNPTEADIETVTVGGTPETVTGQVDNGDGTSTGKISLKPTTVDLDQSLGTITGITYNDDNDDLTAGSIGEITATNLDIIVDVVHVKPTLEDVTYEDVHYTLGDSVDVELTFDNPTEADIETVTVGGNSVLVDDADQTDDGLGTTTVTVTLIPTTIGLDQTQGTITEFTYDNDDDNLTPGVVGQITATNLEVIVDVVHVEPTLTDVTFTDRQYTLGESVEVELTFTNPTEADIETVTVGGTLVSVTDQADNGDETSTGKITLTPTTVDLDQSLGIISGITYDDDNDDLTAGANGAITATNIDIIVDVIHVVPTLTAVSYDPGPYAKSSDVAVELEFNNPTKATIEDVEVTNSGTPTLYQFTETGYDDVTKTTTGTINLTASGLGIDQSIGTITGFTYNHDEDVTTAEVAGTISTALLPTDLEIKVDISGQAPTLEITGVSVNQAEYEINEAATVTMEFTNPDCLKIESINVSGTPVTVTEGAQIDDAENGTSTVTISFNAPSTSTDVNPTLGTIKGFTYNDAVSSQTVTFDATNEIPLMVSLIYVPITTAAELQAIETSATSQKADPDAVYRVMNDITWDGVTSFVPITGFAATFEGQDNSITGYYSTQNGLFASTTADAVIENIHIDGNVTNTASGTGLLVGNNAGKVENSSSSGSVSGREFTGGLVGYTVAGSSVTNSHSSANASSTENGTGALVGQSQGIISNCYATGNASSGGWTAGGLVGWANTGTVITNCYATGNATTSTISAGAGNAGGLVGYLDGTVSSSYATGNATCTNGDGAGGLVGYAESGNISNSYASGNVAANNNACGLVGDNIGGATIVNSFAYQYQETNGVPISASTDGGATGIATYGNLCDTTWLEQVLGTGFEYSAGNNPHLFDSTGSVAVPGQDTWIPVEETVIEITNAQELQDVDQHPEATNPDAIFIVMNDIDMADPNYLIADFDPIDSFAATFDGQGYKISNYSSTQGSLFAATTSTSLIMNIGIEVDIAVVDVANVGGLVGLNYGKIYNSYSMGTINSSGAGSNFTGGLVGWNDHGLVENCYSTVSVTGNMYVGGLVGLNRNADVVNSYAAGDVRGASCTGGLIGLHDNFGEETIGSATLTNCYATGNVYGTDNVGGLTGYTLTASISNCFATGNVTGNSANSAGLTGIFAPGIYNYTITNSYAYELQTVNGALVKDNLALAGTGTTGQYITFDQLVTTGGQEVLGSTGFIYQAGNYPKVNSTYGGEILGQTWISIEKVIEIVTAAQLQGIDGHSTKADTTVTYRVMNDINLSSGGISDFNPIDGFGTTFEGQGYLISDYNSTTNGLFASTTTGAVIDNVHIEGSVSCTFNDVALLVGSNSGLIKNSSSSGSVYGENYVGGLVGLNPVGTITNSHSDAVVSGATDVGGLVGNNRGTVTSSHATGSVTGRGIYTTGGLAGFNGGTIDDSYATGAVQGTGELTGGLVGISEGTISNSYATGTVTGKENTGGLVGESRGSATISNCYATGTVTAVGNDVGGLVGQLSGTVTNCYATGNVTNTGTFATGGLVGWVQSGASVTKSYATGTVNGNDIVGGLVGTNDGSVTKSYATGIVYGSFNVKAVIGINTGTIDDCHAYENQLVNNLPVDVNSSGANWIATYDQLITDDWQWYRLGDSWKYQAGNYPHVENSNTGEPLQDQTLVPINVFEITNAQELQAVEFHIQKGNPNFIFKVMNDIVIPNGTDFNSINNFGATFNGQGYTISNYNSTQNGLFNETSNTAVIDNAHIVGTVSASGHNLGLLVGSNSGHIKNSSASGTVTTSTFNSIGGLVGEARPGSTTENSYSEVNVNGQDNVGGLVGFAEGATIKNCYASGTVTSTGQRAGGLVGLAINSAAISNSYATGNVSANGNAGGLVGSLESGSRVDNCFATGNITASFEGKGLVGWAPSGTGGFHNSYAYQYQKVNNAYITQWEMGATGIVNYNEHLNNPAWLSGFLGTAFNCTNQGYYPKLYNTSASQELPGQADTLIKTSKTSLNEDSNSDKDQAVDDSTSAEQAIGANDEVADPNGVEQVPPTEGDTAEDELDEDELDEDELAEDELDEEAEKTEELISLNVYEKMFGFKSKILSS